MALDRGKSPYTGGRFTLELDDHKPVGFVTSIDGGHFKSEAVASTWGASFATTRYPGKPKYEDITVTVGMAMSPAFWKWVQATLDGKPERRNGALVAYDFNNKERSRRTFKRALLSEIGFPSLDAASKQSALLTIKISPEQLEFAEGDGSSLRLEQAQNELSKQKLWLTSNFRFQLDRFGDDASLRNAKIESFTVKQNVMVNPVGSELESRKEPGRVELPQLQVSFPESSVAPWMKWFDETVVQGKPRNTTGSITYYASDNQKTELMRVDLDGVGLTSLEPEKYEAHKESIARVKATLYLEGMHLKSGKGTA